LRTASQAALSTAAHDLPAPYDALLKPLTQNRKGQLVPLDRPMTMRHLMASSASLALDSPCAGEPMAPGDLDFHQNAKS
jgi:hypothetical protein